MEFLKIKRARGRIAEVIVPLLPSLLPRHLKFNPILKYERVRGKEEK
jgi:hypothetical protein